MCSPWIYLALFSLAALDAFAPAFPSETLVVTAGVFAANGEPTLVGVIVVATFGAFVGDHVSYAIGRRVGTGVVSRLRPGTKRHQAYAWARSAVSERGGLVLVVGRYVPGGRTATTLTMGTIRYPLRLFTAFTALATTSWGVYCALVGYLGGRAFEQDPLKGLVLGLGIALAVAAAVEGVRYARGRRRGAESVGAVHHPRLVRDDRGLDPVADTEPGEDRAHVRLDRSLDEVQPPADLGVGQS